MVVHASKARKKLPKELAVINADNCTGCDACIEVCPVDGGLHREGFRRGLRRLTKLVPD